MKIYNPEDGSLVELSTCHEKKLQEISKDSEEVEEYAKFHNDSYDVAVNLEKQITKHGNL